MHEEEIECHTSEQSGNGINGIMRHDVNRGETHEQEKRQHEIEQLAVPAVPRKQHEHGGYANVRAWECCCWTLSGIVCLLHKVIERTVCPARACHSLCMSAEIVVEVWEYAFCYVFKSYCMIVVLRACNRQVDEYHVICEEGCEYDERCTLELAVAVEEIIQRNQNYKGLIAGIAKVHKLAEPVLRHGLMEQ